MWNRVFIRGLKLSCLALFGLAVWAPAPLRGGVTRYSAPAGANLSTVYQLEVDDGSGFVPVSVYDAKMNARNAHFAIFDMVGCIQVRVTVSSGLPNFNLRPAAAGLAPVRSGNQVTFTLGKPGNYVFERDGKNVPLFLFVNPPESGAPVSGAPGVTYYGPGIYTGQNISLSSGDTLYIAGGAIVKGRISVASGASGVTIRGRGILDASNLSTNSTITGSPITVGKFASNVTIQDIVISDGPGFTWNVVLQQVATANIIRLRILAQDDYSTDGLDMLDCSNVTVQGCFIYTYDDAIAIKADYLCNKTVSTGCSSVPPSKNIWISDSVLYNRWSNGVEIGMELNSGLNPSGAIDNINVTNCDFLYGAWDVFHPYFAAVSIHNAGNSTVSNVTFQDIRVEEPDGQLVNLQVMNSTDFSKTGYGGTGKINGVNIINLRQVSGNPSAGGEIKGYDATHNVANVSFTNFTINGAPANGSNLTIGSFTSNITFSTALHTPTPVIGNGCIVGTATPTALGTFTITPTPTIPAVDLNGLWYDGESTGHTLSSGNYVGSNAAGAIGVSELTGAGALGTSHYMQITFCPKTGLTYAEATYDSAIAPYDVTSYDALSFFMRIPGAGPSCATCNNLRVDVALVVSGAYPNDRSLPVTTTAYLEGVSNLSQGQWARVVIPLSAFVGPNYNGGSFTNGMLGIIQGVRFQVSPNRAVPALTGIQGGAVDIDEIRFIVAGSRPTGPAGLTLDDFESKLRTQWGGTTMKLAGGGDGACTGVSKNAYVFPSALGQVAVTSGGTTDTPCGAAHMSGSLGSGPCGATWPYITLFEDLKPTYGDTVDLSGNSWIPSLPSAGAAGLRFRAKVGAKTGQTYQIVLERIGTATTGNNHFFVSISDQAIPVGTWWTFEINFPADNTYSIHTDPQQTELFWGQAPVSAGYAVGTQVKWFRDDFYRLSIAPVRAGSFDLWVDDIEFYGDPAVYTATPTMSPTVNLTTSPTPTASPSASPTQTATPSPSPSPSPTASYTTTPSPSPSRTASNTPSGTPSITVTPSFSVTLTNSRTPSNTVSPTASNTANGTFTETPTFSESPTETPSPSITLTLSSSPTSSETPSATMSPSPTLTGTPSSTGTLSSTMTLTASVTPTESITPTASITPTPSITPTASSSQTVSPTFSVSPTFTQSPTANPTATSTPDLGTIGTTVPAGRVEAVVANPNPQSGPGLRLQAKFSGPMAEVRVRIYSRAYMLNETVVLPGTTQAGWKALQVPVNLVSGTYFVVLDNPHAAAGNSRSLCVVAVLR